MEGKELVKKARLVKKNAYAPYSDYRVGAVLLTGGGSVYKGVNIENITLDMTSHAERTAIKSAVTDGETEFSALAISTQGEEGAPPCATCRQFIAEFCSDDFVIYSDLGNEEFNKYKLSEIYPEAFRPSTVENDKESNF